MAQKNKNNLADITNLTSDFEVITRRMRWAAIVIIVACFPFDPTRAYYLYAAAIVAVLFNLTRYSETFMRSATYASPVVVLIADNIFIALLIALVSDVGTPFTAFLVFMIVTAGYKYKLRGTLIVVGAQLLAVLFVLSRNWFPSLYLDDIRAGILTASVLIGLGVYVDLLTRIEREEKDSLERLSGEIESERMHLLTLVNSLNDAIYVVDDHGRISDYNAAAAALSDLRTDLYGKPFARALKLHPHITMDDMSGKSVELLKSYAGPQHRRDLSVRDSAGAITDLDITVQPVRLQGKKTTDYIVVCKDITKERTLDEQRNEFISLTSHELRTPITVMEAALSAALINREKLDYQTLGILEQAHRHCRYLASLVKDLSLIAEANNDNLPVKLEQVNPRRLLHQMVLDFADQAKQKGLAIKLVIESDTPTIISTENHIHEILQNYITNALKYTPKGKIIVRAGPSTSGGVVFSVQDKGIGISPTDQKHLFTKFFRSEDYRTRQTGGSGLGLYLCMQLAQRLNGKVWCESKFNEGSTFYLEVPPVSHLKQDQGKVLKAEVASLVEEI